jgi:DNA-binding CsgD family transcriptional regulator
MADGVHPDQPGAVLLLTEDAASGEAIAAACARRKVQIAVDRPRSSREGEAEVVLVDLSTIDEPLLSELLERAAEVGRVIGIGASPSAPVRNRIDAHVHTDASISDLLAAIAGSVRPRPSPGAAAARDLEVLSPREREVMALLLAGLSARDAGEWLGITENTVRTHIQNVLAKLAVKSRAEAAAWVMRAGLAPADVAAGSGKT